MPELMEHESIDVVAGRAAAALHRAASTRPLPELSVRSPRRWAAPVAALAAIVVVVVGLIAIGTNRNESVGNDPANLRWLLRDVPSGWKATSVLDSTTTPARRPSPDPFVMNVYATDAEPLGPYLTVQGTTDTTQSIDIGSYSGEVLGYEEFDLDGKRAAFATLPSGNRGLYVEINSVWAYLTSRGLDDNVLRVLARTLAPDAGGHFDVAESALPDGMRRVVTTNDQPGDYVSIDYSPPGGGGSYLHLTIGPSTPTNLGRGAMGYEFEKFSAGDISGFVGSLNYEYSTPPTTAWLVLWRRDGLDFLLSGQGVSHDQMLDAATSASQASSEEWAELVGSQVDNTVDTAPPGTAPADATVDTAPTFAGEPRDVAIGVKVEDVSSNRQRWSGVLPSGESWTAEISRVYHRLDIRYFVDGDLAESSFGTSTQFAGDHLVTCCNPIAMTTDPKATALRILRSNGDRYTIPLHELPGTDGVRIALIAIPDGTLLAELIDASGDILESYAPH